MKKRDSKCLLVLIFMGVAGSGKTTVAKLFAKKTGAVFYEGDDFHPPENIAKMSAGHALNDDDRRPWLNTIGEWLADHAGGGVMSCSALKQSYRDQLRDHCPSVEVLHLAGTPEVIGRRQASRPGHFMPASLLASQFETLEPLAATERGVVIDVDQDIDSIVNEYVSLTRQEQR